MTTLHLAFSLHRSEAGWREHKTHFSEKRKRYFQAEGDAEADFGEGGRGLKLRLGRPVAASRNGPRTENIENNPMQSSLAVADLRDPATTFLTRPANHLQYFATCKPPMHLIYLTKFVLAHLIWRREELQARCRCLIKVYASLS
jgi:hypothetical protein